MSVCFSSCNRFIASGSADKTVKLWSFETWTNIGTFSGHSGPVNSAKFSPCSQFVASGGGEDLES